MAHRLLPKLDAGTDGTAPGDSTELKWEFDEDLGRYYVFFRRSVVEPSWGDRGHYAFGVFFILVP